MIGRVVEQKDVRTHEQCAREGYAHAPAAAELLHLFLRLHRLREAQTLQDTCRLRLCFVCTRKPIGKLLCTSYNTIT